MSNKVSVVFTVSWHLAPPEVPEGGSNIRGPSVSSKRASRQETVTGELPEGMKEQHHTPDKIAIVTRPVVGHWLWKQALAFHLRTWRGHEDEGRRGTS